LILSPRSEQRLVGVHPDLVAIIRRAADFPGASFVVTEGVRTMARQKQLVASGASTTLKSRHLTGHRVDLAALVGGVVRWDWPLYYKLAATVKQAAIAVGHPVEWGGDWKSFKDGPHFQLPWATYP
jgi:peptidoglycan L-alanyl-D-glutamate endopeptidase CwlK